MFFKRSLEDRVEKAKEDHKELNQLIEQYKPFIASTVQKKTGRYLTYGYDDELTIGMMAFKEAVDSYDKEKGKFLSFAKQVISLRVIDYYRKHKKKNKEVFLSEIKDEEDETVYEIGTSQAIADYKDREENEIRKIEIGTLKKQLQEWDIDFTDLVKASPKQEKLRNLYKRIAKIIVEDEEIYHDLMSKKRLPIKEIEKKFPIHRKKIERGRIYIITLVLVLSGEYDFMKDYINWR